MTTAARAVCGRSASSPLRKRSRTATSPAPISPVICVFAPDWSATAVREPLTETAKPWKNPAAMFDVPIPTISWSGFTSSPRFAAKLVAVAMVSVSDTMVMPTAPRTRGPTSDSLVHGNAGTGTPWGSEPTVFTPWAARSSTAETTVTPTTATRTAGTRLVIRGRTSNTARTHSPVISVVRLVWSSPLEEGPHLAGEVVGAGRESEELRELPDDDGDGQTVEVADADLAGEEVGDETEFGQPQSDLDEPDQYRQHAGERHARWRGRR